MKSGKYRVRLMRPVFQSVVVEVSAADEKEAANVALRHANSVPESEWIGIFDAYKYGHDVQYVLDMEDVDSEEQADFICHDIGRYRQYALLKADTSTGEGTILFQPWMAMESDVVVAGFCSDWNTELQEVRYEQASQYVAEQVKTSPSGKPKTKAKIIPFTKAPGKRK